MLRYLVDFASIVAAAFGILTYVGQINSDAIATAALANTDRIADAAVSTAQLNTKMLQRIDRMLPEAERTRLGIDKIAQAAQDQLTVLQGLRSAQSRPVTNRARDDRRATTHIPRVDPQGGDREEGGARAWITEAWKRFAND